MNEAYEGQHSYTAHRPDNHGARDFIHTELRFSCCQEAPFVYWYRIEAAIKQGADPIETANRYIKDYWEQAEDAMKQKKTRREFLRELQQEDRSVK